jgi:ankyrin repeat protein
MNHEIDRAISYRKLDRVKQLLKKDKGLLERITRNSIYDYLYLREYKNLARFLDMLPRWKTEQLMSSIFVFYLFDVNTHAQVKELYAFVKRYKFNMCLSFSFKGIPCLSMLDIFMMANCVAGECSVLHKKVFDLIYSQVKKCYERDYFLNRVLDAVNMIGKPLNILFLRAVIDRDMVEDKNIDILHPLFLAVRYNNLDFIKLLMEKKVDINMSNNIIKFALAEGTLEIVIWYLIDKGARIDTTADYYELPFQTMYMRNTFSKYSLKLKRKLLEGVKDLNHQDMYGETCVHYIVMHENWRDFKDILTLRHFDVNLKDKLGESVLQLLKEEDRGAFLQVIRQVKTSEPEEVVLPDAKNAPVNLSNSTMIDIMVYIMQLLQKYPEISIPFEPYEGQLNFSATKLSERDQYIATQTAISVAFINKNTDDSVYIHPALKGALQKQNTKYTFLYVSLMYDTGLHANCIVIDNSAKRIYHFEPNGRYATEGRNLTRLYKMLDQYFKKALPAYTYHKPDDFLPVFGFQRLSNEDNIDFIKINDLSGYCLAWCFWFTELFLKNKNTNVKQLVEKAIKKMVRNEYYIKDFIRNYANNMFRNKIDFLVKEGIGEHLLYNSNMPAVIEHHIINAISAAIKQTLHKE